MVGTHALVVYRNRAALVKEQTGDKVVIALAGGEQVKVREKDFEVLHPGQTANFQGLDETGSPDDGPAIGEAWELLLADGGNPVSLSELAELVYGNFTPVSAWNTFRLLLDGLYFSGTIGEIRPRQKDQVEAERAKRAGKQREETERSQFLERLRKRAPELSSDGTTDDRRFIQDIEALAYGKSPKSRTMKDLGLGETPEAAHALLLESGFWSATVNPWPARFGVSTVQARQVPPPPPVDESRVDLCRLPAFAIDSPWSHDPDDALSLETDGDRQILYVHVADPASSITADSPCEREARDRGATLYVPEGSFRMLAEETLPLFALGLAETSPALTFKIALDASGKIADTEIFPSIVKVSRITYEAADRLITEGNDPAAEVLTALALLAERNLDRRTLSGAVHIQMPETHMSVEAGEVRIEPIEQLRSAVLVRECMLLAGEAAGLWATQRGIPLPYVTQEVADLPGKVLPGLAGSYQLRRCMRSRALSTKPGLHFGLGLDIYTQVTSPLRRYTDLLGHIQIRAALKGLPPLPVDELAARVFAGEAAAQATVQAERSSRAHWLAVYLADKKDLSWQAVALEKKAARWLVSIPALALETQVSVRRDLNPNDELCLVLKSVNLPTAEVVFAGE